MESQSRYSIVERLTRQKLDIMDAKNDLDLDIINKEQRLDDKAKEFESWKKNCTIIMERDREEQENEIIKVSNSVEVAKQRKDEKAKHFDAKIVQLNNALKAIESISKDAPTPEEQV